jgi:predicted porin
LAALAASAAFAQSSVTLYGILDYGFGTINHSPNNDPVNSAASPVQPTNAVMTNANQLVGSAGVAGAPVGRLTSFMGNNVIPSRWGITGTEDLGAGMKANFRLESPVQVATGAIPNGKQNDTMPGSGTAALLNAEGSYTGALFSREATVGLEGGFGSVKLGRQTTINADAVGAYDPMKAGFAVSPLGFNGGYSGGGFTSEARWDNSLKYAYAINNALTARFGYRTGNLSGIGAAANAWSGNLEYNGGNWGMVVSYVEDHDALNNGNNGVISAAPNGNSSSTTTNYSATATAYPSLTAYFADTKATFLGLRVNQGPVTYKAGYEHIQIANPSNTTGLSIANIPSMYGLPVSAVNINSYNTPQVQNLFYLGANWQVSAPLELSAAYYVRKDSTYGSITSSGTYGVTGITPYSLTQSSKANYLSFMANYSLSKRTRLYATANFTNVSGGAWTATQYTQVSAINQNGVTSPSKYSTSGYGNTFTVPNLQVLTVGVVHNF